MLKREGFLLLFLFIFSLLIHLIFLLSSLEFFTCFPPAIDEDFYYLLIQLYHEKSPLVIKEPFYYSPLYFFILLLLSYLTPDYIFYIKIINILLGSFLPIIVYLTLKNLFDSQKIAFLVAFSFTITDIFLFYNLTSLKVSSGIFLFALSILFLIKDKYFRAGLFLGLSTLVYGGLLLSAILILLLLLITKNIRKALFFFLSFSFIIFITAYINYSRTHDFVLITAVDGIHFFIGNWKNAIGVYTPVPGIRPNPFGHYFDAKNIAEFMEGKNKLKPSEVSRFWKKQALKHIKENKFKSFKNFLKKIFLSFNYQSIPNNYYLPEIKQRTLLKFTLPFQIWLILGLSGFFLSLLERKNIIYLYILFTSTTTYLALFFVNDRYRLPLLFLLILFSHYFLLYIMNKANIKKLFISIILALLMVFMPIKLPNFYSENHTILSTKLCILKRKLKNTKGKLRAQIYEQLGDFYTKIGGKEWAIFYYKKALDLKPNNRILRKKLFKLYFQ